MIEPMDILVKADNHERIACPVWVQLPLTEGGVLSVRMTDEGGKDTERMVVEEIELTRALVEASGLRAR